MKGLLVFSLAILAVSASPSGGTRSWNELLGAAVFDAELDSVQGRSTEVSALLQQLLDDPQILDKTYQNYLSLFKENAGTTRDFESGVMGNRPQIFKNNLLRIAKHNIEAEAGEHTWTMGVNQFTAMTDEEFHSIYTPALVDLPGAFEAAGIPQVSLGNLNQSPPKTKNWVTEKKVTPVKNQQQCGSCYAFATCGALESAYAINNPSKALLDLAEQEMVDCSKNSGCNGGFWYDSFDYMKGGITTEANYPYKAVQQSCTNSTGNKATKAAAVKEYALTKQGDEATMVQTVAAKGPLAVAVSTKNWNTYKSGVFQGDCGTGVDHAVLLVGYSETDYTIKNSWDTTWGEQGYIRLKRGGNQCQVANYPCWVNSK